MKIKPTEYDGYFVSSCGKVLSRKSGELKELSTHTDKRKGYVSVSLYANGGRLTRKVHTLVAKAFVANPDSRTEVDHVDRDRANNNSTENLRWSTCKENLKNRVLHTRKIGQFNLDGTLLKRWESIAAITANMGFNQSCIAKCCSDKYKNKSYKKLQKTTKNYIWKYLK